MSFEWPSVFWLLLAVPALVGAYVLMLRRRKRTALRFPSLGLTRQAMTSRPSAPAARTAAVIATGHGTYFHAGTADDLKRVYQDLNARLVLERKDIEITLLFAAAAAVLLLASSALSLWCFNRIA